MKQQSYILKSTGEKIPVEPKNGSDFQLDELREAIGGGWIETVQLENDQVMVMDEEGKLKQLPPNVQASRLYNQRHGFHNPDIIAGDALVCHNSQLK